MADNNLRDTGARISAPRIEVKHGQVSGAQTLEALNVGAAKGAAPGEIRTTGLAANQKALTLANGTNNNVAIANASYIRVSGPTAAFTITGFDSGRDGALLFVENDTTQSMTLANQNAGSTAANRIVTQSGADVVLTGRSIAMLIYDSNSSRWQLVNFWNGPVVVSLTSASADLGSDVNTGGAGVYGDGPSLSLAAGTWLITAGVTTTDGANATGDATAKLWDGTTVFASGEATYANLFRAQIALSAIVSPTSTTTYKISAAGSGGVIALKASTASNGTPPKATWIRAVKVA